MSPPAPSWLSISSTPSTPSDSIFNAEPSPACLGVLVDPFLNSVKSVTCLVPIADLNLRSMVDLATFFSNSFQNSSFFVISAHHALENKVQPESDCMTAGITVPCGTATERDDAFGLRDLEGDGDGAGIAEAADVLRPGAAMMVAAVRSLDSEGEWRSKQSLSSSLVNSLDMVSMRLWAKWVDRMEWL